jgi:5-methylthioadenosine/S-adenosylhomocysteine deaminase
MQKYGINVCLGTDGSASNNRLDMFREMYLATTSQNILLSNAGVITSRDVLKMATINGAKALGLNGVGALEAGNFADLVMLNSHGVDGVISHNIFDNIVYSYGTEDVLLTMCNGKILYDGKKYYFKKSQKQIMQKASEVAEKFK